MIVFPFCLALACNLGGKPVTDDSSTGDSNDTSAGSDTTIADIRTSVVPLDSSVTVQHVIVTSPHTQGDEGFFVQDAGGGPNSGIYVWAYDAATIAAIFAVPGDEVTITGTPTDYYGWFEFAVDSVEITGSGAVPAPIDLGDGSSVTDWDPYESVLVSLTSQSVLSVNEYGTALLSSSSSSGDVYLDNGFYDEDVVCGGIYPTVTGIMFYSYEEYSINPRDSSDLSDPELGATIDATAAEIQSGICGAVTVTNLVVTSDVWTDDDGDHFYAQDEGGGEGTGLSVLLTSGSANVSINDTISATGSTGEPYGLTQLIVASSSDLEVTGTSVAVATILSEVPTDYESWESCLITLTDVDLTGTISDYGDVTTSWGVSVDDLFYSFSAPSGDHWDTVTGPLDFTYGVWTLEPRSASDLH